MIFSTILLMAAPAAAGAINNSKIYNPNKVVCRMEYELGSKIPFRVCKTAETWKAWEKEMEEDVRNARKNRACIGADCNPS